MAVDSRPWQVNFRGNNVPEIENPPVRAGLKNQKASRGRLNTPTLAENRTRCKRNLARGCVRPHPGRFSLQRRGKHPDEPSRIMPIHAERIYSLAANRVVIQTFFMASRFPILQVMLPYEILEEHL